MPATCLTLTFFIVVATRACVSNAFGAQQQVTNTLLMGNGISSSANGIDGGVYLDLANWDIYVKQKNSWMLLGSIRGEKGLDGLSLLNGLDVPENLMGKNGD